jgi:RNA polymerase sigma-70 factor (ECF subfamily)
LNPNSSPCSTREPYASKATFCASPVELREPVVHCKFHIAVSDEDYERAVISFYEGLYRFAYSLARNEHDASELTQETFAKMLAKGGQLRDPSKIKSWLFTTLYRIYLGWKRRETSHPHFEITSVEEELPVVTPETVDRLETEAVLQVLLGIEERYRVPVMLYYFEDLSYLEIAELLDLPIGTVMSRLSNAKSLIRKSLAAKPGDHGRRTTPINYSTGRN